MIDSHLIYVFLPIISTKNPTVQMNFFSETKHDRVEAHCSNDMVKLIQHSKRSRYTDITLTVTSTNFQTPFTVDASILGKVCVFFQTHKIGKPDATSYNSKIWAAAEEKFCVFLFFLSTRGEET